MVIDDVMRMAGTQFEEPASVKYWMSHLGWWEQPLTEAIAKIDSKGRVAIPQDMREELGYTVVVKKTREGVVLRPSRTKVWDDLEKILDWEPRRTGKPESPSPQQMKRIWNE